MINVAREGTRGGAKAGVRTPTRAEPVGTGTGTATQPTRGWAPCATRGERALVAGPLADALAAEIQLLQRLAEIMRRKRLAAVAGDFAGVDHGIYAAHRVLITLREARQRRRFLLRRVSGTAELPLEQLEAVLGARMTDALRAARDTLLSASLTLWREVVLTQIAVRDALGR